MKDDELIRYGRHILLPNFDYAGQKKLRASHALIVGLGGLGSPVALYLAAAGIGRLSLVDFDLVELSNLQRQIIHGENDIGLSKIESARKSALALNRSIEIDCFQKQFHEDLSFLDQAIPPDIVIDCTDNFATRYRLNQWCFQTKIPLVSGAALRFEGQVTVFDPRSKESPCYHCLYPDQFQNEELSCVDAGILGPVVGIIGSIQATEAIKVITGIGTPLTGRLLLLDALTMSWRSVTIPRDPACPVCGSALG